MASQQVEPVDLFYSYAHEDEALRDELAGHLKIMERRGVIRPWHDRSIVSGQQWDTAINEHLLKADLVLLLVSKDFINSDYIWGHELDVAMKRQERGEASVIPVMLRAVDIAGAPFADLQGLPTDLKPVTSWTNRDEAWTDVAKGIRRTVELIQAKWSRIPPSPSPAPPAAPAEVRAMAPESAMESEGSEESTQPGRTAPHREKPMAASPLTAKVEEVRDPLLDRVVQEFSECVTKAANARGVPRIDEEQTNRYARVLIDAPDQQRILWVDDRPAQNRCETAALAKLQIEVVAVTSTTDALAKLDSDPEPFDLILSDWQRPEPDLGETSAGIHLLRQVRKTHPAVPVVFYHGSFDERERAARREQALREGAVGEAVMPDELVGLVTKVLAKG